MIDESKSFYVYETDQDLLYKIVNFEIINCGKTYYTVEVYEGEVIDTIEENEDLYNIIKFNENVRRVETQSASKYLNNDFDSMRNVDIISYKFKDFDFKKPIKIITENIDEDEEDDDYDSENED
jgi:hypothetical protein